MDHLAELEKEVDFEYIIENFTEPWYDEDFPPVKESIYTLTSNVDLWEEEIKMLKETEFSRIREIYPRGDICVFNDIRPGDIK